jgi:hypothetical protein
MLVEYTSRVSLGFCPRRAAFDSENRDLPLFGILEPTLSYETKLCSVVGLIEVACDLPENDSSIMVKS